MNTIPEELLQFIITYLNEEGFVKFIQTNKYVNRISRDKEIKTRRCLLQILPVAHKFTFKHIYYDLNNWDEKLIPQSVTEITFHYKYDKTMPNVTERKYEIHPHLFMYGFDENLFKMCTNVTQVAYKIASNLGIFKCVFNLNYNYVNQCIINKNKYFIGIITSNIKHSKKILPIHRKKAIDVINALQTDLFNIPEIIENIREAMRSWFYIGIRAFDIFKKYIVIYDNRITVENFDRNLVLECLNVCVQILDYTKEGIKELEQMIKVDAQK
jgi:hypothetical protein